jgi:WD40 repeat protein
VTQDGKIMLWNANTGALTHTLEGHQDWVLNVRWQPNGQTLLSSGWDGAMRMWNPTDGKCLGVYSSTVSPAMAVAWRPDGLAFASR